MKNSPIEWTHHTFNHTWGCAKISPACDHCYAERLAARFGTKWGHDAQRRVFSDKHWDEPLRWDKRCARLGIRERVFCASMADVFDKNAPEGTRERLWALIKSTPNLDWLILTKRIGNAKNMLPDDWGSGYKNAWLGITVCNQDEADRDIPKLLDTPARVRFLSMEPLLSPVNIARWLAPWSHIDNRYGIRIDWVIAGGESGSHARPMHPFWVRGLRDQCKSAAVPFFFKQWGEWLPDSQTRRIMSDDEAMGYPAISLDHHDEGHSAFRVGKQRAGRLLDGEIWNQLPIAEAA